MDLTVKSVRKRRKGVEVVFSDGGQCLLSEEVCLRHGFHPGMPVRREILDQARRESQNHFCMQAALSLLDHAARSERKLAERLARKGYDPTTVRDTIEQCVKLNYLDDQRYAATLVEELKNRGKGRRAVANELYKKGIEKEIASQVMDGFATPEEELEGARAVAARKIATGTMKNLANDKIKFKRRLASHLRSRGFPMNIVWQVVDENA